MLLLQLLVLLVLLLLLSLHELHERVHERCCLIWRCGNWRCGRLHWRCSWRCNRVRLCLPHCSLSSHARGTLG